MKTYALVHAGVVVQCLTTAADVMTLFHRDVVCVDITASRQAIEPGWNYSGGDFAPPPMESVPVPAAPSLVSLQAQLAALTAQIAQLAPHA